MRSVSTPMSPDLPRRHTDIPAAPRRRTVEDDLPGKSLPEAAEPEPAPSPSSAPTVAKPGDTERRLIVGRDISLNGEISACDHLVVEGRIEARLKDCRTIEISDSGVFKGAADIEEADIGGRFDGDLSVRGRLMIRSSGVITGTVTYGRLEVESGGQLIGSVQPLDHKPESKPVKDEAPASVMAAPRPHSAPDTPEPAPITAPAPAALTVGARYGETG